MADLIKQIQSSSFVSELKALLSVLKTGRTKSFLVYGFMFAFVACTASLAFNPSCSQISSPFSYILPLSSLVFPSGSSGSGVPGRNQSEGILGSREIGVPAMNRGKEDARRNKDGILEGENRSGGGIGMVGNGVPTENLTGNGVSIKNQSSEGSGSQNRTGSGVPANKEAGEKGGVLDRESQNGSGVTAKNPTNDCSGSNNRTISGVPTKNVEAGSQGNATLVKNQTAAEKSNSGETVIESLSASMKKKNNGGKEEYWIKDLINCDIFQGNWVKDESYPLYPEGSCPHMDKSFNCYLNGRPDRAYQKLRWQPNGCNIPRLNATDMLERLRGKRLVFIGDSLNRNMWESLVCILRNSIEDKGKVFEVSGKREFRTEGSYSFLFKDYSCMIEFFRAPFLVQEWVMPDKDGNKRETLRLDVIEKSSSRYKDAHVLIYNTGHWWTHKKTSKGEDYYQEGNHVYHKLNVMEAYRRALNTWGKWVDANVNTKKTLVFFRGYSASHFSGGQWNSGGACDKETEPIKNDTYLLPYPAKGTVLETVLSGMKTPISYLNITRMSDYRKEAHPSVYRKPNLTEKERTLPERYQDCSHWCLPGVPDLWNELLYAQILIKQYQQ